MKRKKRENGPKTALLFSNSNSEELVPGCLIFISDVKEEDQSVEKLTVRFAEFRF
jgi:hypothetical protein